jgi:hypothetical protein
LVFDEFDEGDEVYKGGKTHGYIFFDIFFVLMKVTRCIPGPFPCKDERKKEEKKG